MRILTLLVSVLAAACLSAGTFAAAQTSPLAKEDQKRMDGDIEIIDAYLAKLDRFARGEKSLVPELNREGAAFGSALGRALKSNDKRAPARLVFSAVVQVAGSIPVDSDLGKSAATILGPKFPIVETKRGRTYFAGDLYFWWLDHQKAYEPYPLFDEWAKRDFAQKSVIPMYKRLHENEKKPSDH